MTATETVGVEHLVGYYDASGALQDVVLNHLFQAGFHIRDGAGDFV
jgi:glucose-6-phosphate 1-dehydrogenase